MSGEIYVCIMMHLHSVFIVVFMHIHPCYQPETCLPEHKATGACLYEHKVPL